MSGRTPDEGRYSKVTRRMWDDERFCELSPAPPNAQTLWQRLLTGPELGCVPGLFKARIGGLADALGWPAEALREKWQEISDKEMAFADWRVGLVWVPNAIVHNAPNSPNTILGWRLALRELPECELKRQGIAALRHYCSNLGPTWLAAFDAASLEPKSKQPSTGKALRKPSKKPIVTPSGTPSATVATHPIETSSDSQDQDQEQDSGNKNQDPDLAGEPESGVVVAVADLRPPVADVPPVPPNEAPNEAPKAPQRDVRSMAEKMLRNRGMFMHEFGDSHRWPEVQAVCQAFEQTWGRKDEPVHGGDVRAIKILERLAEGIPVERLALAVKRSKFASYILADPAYQCLMTILRDAAQVDKFCAMTGPPRKAGEREAKQPEDKSEGAWKPNVRTAT